MLESCFICIRGLTCFSVPYEACTLYTRGDAEVQFGFADSKSNCCLNGLSNSGSVAYFDETSSFLRLV